MYVYVYMLLYKQPNKRQMASSVFHIFTKHMHDGVTSKHPVAFTARQIEYEGHSILASSNTRNFACSFIGLNSEFIYIKD